MSCTVLRCVEQRDASIHVVENPTHRRPPPVRHAWGKCGRKGGRQRRRRAGTAKKGRGGAERGGAGRGETPVDLLPPCAEHVVAHGKTEGWQCRQHGDRSRPSRFLTHATSSGTLRSSGGTFAVPVSTASAQSRSCGDQAKRAQQCTDWSCPTSNHAGNYANRCHYTEQQSRPVSWGKGCYVRD